MKIRLYQPVVFDGQTLEGEIDTAGTPISAESIIQRGWGEEIKDAKRSKKSDQEPPPLGESPAAPVESENHRSHLAREANPRTNPPPFTNH